MLGKRQFDSIDLAKPAKKQKTESMLQFTSDPTALTVFLNRIESDEDTDLVGLYLQEADGLEILAMLENGTERKLNELTVILKVLAILIVRTNTDLAEQFSATGRQLSEGILEEGALLSCFRALRPNSSAEVTKASLRVLAAVVSTSPLLGRSLLRSLNFEHSDWVQCCRRKNTKDDCDVRTCFINFVAAFFVADNNLLIRELLESKNVMALLILECFTDKLSNVMLILTLLQTKVVDNPTVSKTIKMRIFTRNALKQLAYLYAYRGESLTAKDSLSKSIMDIDHNAVELVRNTVHKLLHTISSSAISGIVFREHLSTDSVKHNDHLLHLLLSPPMENAYTDELRSELVVDCLVACPNLLPSYISHWKSSLEPRTSKTWQNMMRFIASIFETFRKYISDRASKLLELCDDQSHYVNTIADFCLPPTCLVEPLRMALQCEDAEVIDMANLLLRTFRQNLIVFLTWATIASKDLEMKGTSTVMLASELSKLLPERILVKGWFKRFVKTLNCSHEDGSLLSDQVINKPVSDVDVEVDRDIVKAIPVSTEEVISKFPKKVSKFLLMLHKIGREPSHPPSSKAVQRIARSWSSAVPLCIDKYLHVGAVYACLVEGIRLLSNPEHFSITGWVSPALTTVNAEETFGKDVLSPNPKTILRTLTRKPEVLSILLSQPSEPTELIDAKENDEANNVQLDGFDGLNVPTSDCASLKDGLVDFLFALAGCAPKAAVKSIPALCLLAAYQAGMSPSDQTILRLLYLLDSHGQPITNIWGMTNGCLIWGDRVQDHYRFGKTLHDVPTLWRQPNSNSFISLLDKDRLLRSTLAFPTRRRCLAQSMISTRTDIHSNLYDPCFLLPLFMRFLSSDEESDCEKALSKGANLRTFYLRNCLAFTVAALSSYSRHIRGLAKAVIGHYRNLSEVWQPTKIRNMPTSLSVMKQFPERIQINFIIDSLRNSLSDKAEELGGGSRRSFLFGSKADTSFRLATVHANFFVHALTMLTKPEHRMYEVFWNCFLAKPAIDLSVVPDFMRTVFSVHADYRIERQWIIKLCADSVRDTSDYLLLEKTRVFKYCLLLFSDPGVDATTQIHILRLLTATTKIPRACHALTRFHAFPLWLYRHALSTTHAPFVCYFLQIISQMLSAFADSPALSVLTTLDATFRAVHDDSTFAKRKIKPTSF